MTTKKRFKLVRMRVFGRGGLIWNIVDTKGLVPTFDTAHSASGKEAFRKRDMESFYAERLGAI